MKSIQDTIEALRVLSEPTTIGELEKLKELRLQTKMIGEIFGVFGVSKEKYEALKASKKSIETPVEKEMTFEEKRKLFQAEFPNKVSPARRARAREMLNSIAQNNPFYLQKEVHLLSGRDQSKTTTARSIGMETMKNVLSSGSLSEKLTSIRMNTDENPTLSRDTNPITAQLFTSRSWPTSTDSDYSDADLTAQRVKEKTSVSSTSKATTSKNSIFTMQSTNLKDPYEVDSRFNGVYKFGNYDQFSNFSKSSYDRAYSNETQSASEPTESNMSVYEVVGTPYHYDSELATPVITCVE